MCIKCDRCGEEITAPYWFEGKPYGYSCIKLINPGTKKNKSVEHWVFVDVSDLDLTIPGNKQFVNASFKGKRYRFLALKNSSNTWESIDPYAKIIYNYKVAINIAFFKGYEKSKS